MVDAIEIEIPDDFHHHLRDGEVLADVVEHASRAFGNLLCMPNIKPPVRTVREAEEYRDRIIQAGNSRGCRLPTLLMTLYLTDTTTPEDIIQVKDCGFVKALKLYPAGATTNSEFGVTSYHKIQPVLRAMADAKILSWFMEK